MKLVGKKVLRKSAGLDNKTKLNVDPVKGTIKISGRGLEILNLVNKYIGFAYDEEQSKVYIYIAKDEDGAKVSPRGTFTSRWHARELRNRFYPEIIEKFNLILDTEVYRDPKFENILFYPVYSEEVLASNEEEETSIGGAPIESVSKDTFVQEEAWAHEEESEDYNF